MYVHLLWIILLFTFQNILDVFQYLTDVDVNTTVDDDLISEVCPIVIVCEPVHTLITCTTSY